MTIKKTTKRQASKVQKLKPVAPAPSIPDEALDRLPRVTLTATRETLWLTRHDDRGQAFSTYPVSVKDAANCFRGLAGAGSGLLPEHALFWRQDEQGVFAGLWVPPAVRLITWGTGKGERSWLAPVPGLVFCGRGHTYTVFAAPARPAKESAPLFHAPFANVYPEGRVCHGSVKFPKADLSQLAAAADLFVVSGFNGDMGDGRVKDAANLRAFWEALEGKAQFPLDRLVPAGITIGQLASGKGKAGLQAGFDEAEVLFDPPLGVELDDEEELPEDALEYA